MFPSKAALGQTTQMQPNMRWMPVLHTIHSITVSILKSPSNLCDRLYLRYSLSALFGFTFPFTLSSQENQII